MNMTEPFQQPPHETQLPNGPTQTPAYELRDLLKGRREVLIRHNGEWYRLSITRNDKLILHK